MLTWAELPLRPTITVEVDATLSSPTEAAEYGIIFNYLDSQNFYLFAVQQRQPLQRVAFGQQCVGSCLFKQEDSTALLAGEGNTKWPGLLMEADGYVLTANDEVLTEIDREDPPAVSLLLRARLKKPT